MSRALHGHHRYRWRYHKGQIHWSSNCLIQSGFDLPASYWLGSQPLKIHHSSAALSPYTTIVHPVYLQHPNLCEKILRNPAESRPSISSSTPITSLISPNNRQGFQHLPTTQKTTSPPGIFINYEYGAALLTTTTTKMIQHKLHQQNKYS